MKTFSASALAALRSGNVIVSGAVRFGTATPLCVWGGHGKVTLGSEVYTGLGSNGLVSVSGGSLGGHEQGPELTLSGVDPDAVPTLGLASLRGVSVVIWRLIFSGSGAEILQSSVFLRGRVDRVTVKESPGGEAVIGIGVEGAARGLGRRSERMRSDADQRLISATDGGLRRVAYAGEKAIYWGGQKPLRAGAAFGGGGRGPGDGLRGGKLDPMV